MLEAVTKWVMNMVVFFLVVTLIEHVLPVENYRKYLKVAAGMVLILIVMSPVLKFFNMTPSVDFYFQWESLKNSAAEFDTDDVNRQLHSRIILSYQENLKAQIGELLAGQGYTARSVRLEVEEDMNCENFGKIYAIEVTVRDSDPNTVQTTGENTDYFFNGKDKNNRIAVAVIEKIPEIIVDTQNSRTEDGSRQASSNFQEKNGLRPESIEKITDLLSEYYGVLPENITVVGES